MTAFIGRVQETAALEEAYGLRGGGFVPVYGRRRVGKSELILHFARAKPFVYFVGKRAPAALQIREFLEVAGRALDEPLLAQHPARDWREALTLVARRWTSPKKLVLALDEFQWMVEASPELPSVLQELWDRQWSRERIFLILCGSYVGFMEREVLGKKSPLFGRRTGQIHLKPFSHLEAAAFHPRVSLAQKAMTYFLCGGIPLYLRAFSQDLSIHQNIEKTFLNEFSPLAQEAFFLLREELREVDKYYAILMSLSRGSLPIHEISRRTGVSDRGLTYYLQTLVDLGYLAKRYPLCEVRPAVRHVRYALVDPLLRFWFRFIYPHVSLISQLGPREALREVIQKDLDAYFGLCFETLCREALPLLYAAEGVTAAFTVGEYWNKETQIDVVGLRQDETVDLGECKWGRIPSSTGSVQELRKKSGFYPNAAGRTVHLRLFARETPREAPGIRLHSLNDLYALTQKTG